jgi:Putative adhesin
VSTVRIVLLAALGLLALCGAVFGLSELLRATDTVRSSVAVPIHRIVVRADAGDVDLRAGLTADTVIERHDRWLLRRPEVTQTVRDGTLTVNTHCGGLRAILRCRTDLVIAAPPMVDVVVRTDTGDVDVRGLNGRADIETKSGDIRTHRLEPITVKASTDAGDVNLDLTGQPARTEARSDAGDVRVVVPYGPYRVDAVTDAGNVKVTGIIRDDLAPQAIAALTDAGDITVRAR